MIMREVTYHIKIKKEYASAVMEDLQQVNATEIIEEISWMAKKESIKWLAEMKEFPSQAIKEDDLFYELYYTGSTSGWMVTLL